MSKITQEMVDALVAPEHQYLDAKDPPLDGIRMAWPFKTEEELRALTRWFKEEQRQRKKEEKQRVIELAQALF